MGRLLNDLGSRMSSRAVNGEKDPLKFAVYATHDTALVVCFARSTASTTDGPSLQLQ